MLVAKPSNLLNLNSNLVEETPLPQFQTPELPPAIALLQLITGAWVTQAIYVAASLNVADYLKEQSRTVEELAQLTQAQPNHLYRILRTLASVGIFTEVEPRQFALTEMATYLCSDVPGSLRSLSMTVSDTWQWACFGELLHTVKTGEAAMQRLYQVEDTFEYLTQNPRSGQIFDNAMTGWANNIHTAILDTYDFSGFHKLVDVAGGHGRLIASILKINPNLGGVLFDLPHVVAGAPTLLNAAGIADRCEIIGGSFFGTIPAGADAYLMSHILHDWGDDDCIKMLQNIRKAIAPQGKLLIVEMVIPQGDTAHFGKLLDVAMMSIFAGGRERTESEYAQLFQAAGFQLNRIVPTNGLVSVLEGTCITTSRLGDYS